MTTMDLVVLLHSPLVGPSTWSRVAPILRSLGHTVETPTLEGAVAEGPPYYPALAGRVVQVVRSVRSPTQTVLVVHSGAGALVGSIAGAVPSPPRVIYVDALLPHPGRSWFDIAPTELADHLNTLAVDGVLPPWDQWFPPESLAQLLPEQEIRDSFRAELPRLPVGYFAESVPDGDLLPTDSYAYLRLSEAYDQQALTVESTGRPVIRRDADHLAMLTRPGEVAADIHDLIESWRRAS